MTRIRSIIDHRPKGLGYKNGVYKGGEGVFQLSSRSRCEDQVLTGDCHPFYVNKFFIEGGILNKPRHGGYFGDWFEDYATDVCDSEANFPLKLAYLGDKGNNGYAAIAAARTTPSRPYVDVPVAVTELVDVISLLRGAGNHLIQLMARGNIKYNFGIAPLVSDMHKLTKFQEQVDRRVLEISRLRKSKGLRRTVELDSFSTTEEANMVIQSWGQYFTGTRRTFHTQTVKGHCRWLPTEDLSRLSNPEMSALARKAVLGLTIDFATVWERIPWSWLVDWGSTVGDYFKAKRNIIPAQLELVRVMRHSTSNSFVKVNQLNGYHVSDIHVFRVNKAREPGTVLPIAHFPFLSGKQMGILASLAIMRA